jgi:oxygen-independent coproporphyrinogen-3 oxidase
MPLGIYISVPFCRSKCSYCNFASGVFSRAVYDNYAERVCADIRRAETTVCEMGGVFEPTVDSLYLGGGTPTLLEGEQLRRIFAALRETFAFVPQAEVTVECAPGALSPEMLDVLVEAGVNRVSLGVQSLVDQESRAVGRLHTRATTLDDIRRLRAAGIANLNIDLIAGLPHQTTESWDFSLTEAIAADPPHVSVYMLEVDEDSRLGREVLAGGTRYHAHSVPNEELITDLYVQACERLEAAGIQQYEISNFARPGRESQHNLKYWLRQPYLGFGVEAHSFVPATNTAKQTKADTISNLKFEIPNSTEESVRFAAADSLDGYLAGTLLVRTPVPVAAAREECFFLGLRLTRGVKLSEITRHFGLDPHTGPAITELRDAGLLVYDRKREVISLSPKGRLLSNEVFERFLS